MKKTRASSRIVSGIPFLVFRGLSLLPACPYIHQGDSGTAIETETANAHTSIASNITIRSVNKRRIFKIVLRELYIALRLYVSMNSIREGYGYYTAEIE